MRFKKTDFVKTLLTASVLSASLVTAQAQEVADIVFKNGKILTVSDNFDIADSLAISDNKIVAVGQHKDVASFVGEGTKVIDLKGRTAFPGLIDNHLHFIRGAGSFSREARLDGIFTRKEALTVIQQKAATSKDWVLTLGGFTPQQFTDSSAGFSREELDKVAPDTPVYMQVSYRDAYANSAALKLAGVSDTSGNIKVRSSTGRKLNRAFGGNRRKASSSDITAYMAYLNSLGLTTVYDVGRPSEGPLNPLVEMAKNNNDLPLRVFYTLRYRATTPEKAAEAIESFSKLKPIDITDQSGLIGLGEHIYGPVSDSPRHRDEWPEEDWKPFSDISVAAAKQGWPIHEHTMSNVTIGQYLDLIEKIAVDTPQVKDLRWVFAHVNGIDKAQMKKAAELGVALGVHSQAMMNKRKDSPPIADIANSGVLWGLGSDASVVAPANPFLTLSWAVSGKNISGQQGLTKTISREQALRAHTINNAKMLFMENKVGSLEVGKLADLLVIDEDFMNIDADAIKKIKPVLVIQNGKVVHTTNVLK